MRITRPVKRPHRSGALILTPSFASLPTAVVVKAGASKGAPVRAATSRAMP
ncbi:hypothetical protein D3C78_1655310 [compost metagenome]